MEFRVPGPLEVGAAAPPPASGVVTVLFSDIVASTRRWEEDPAAMASVLARHDELLRRAIEAHRGTVFKHTGDGCCAVFPAVTDAFAAAVAAQVAVSDEDWGTGGPLPAMAERQLRESLTIVRDLGGRGWVVDSLELSALVRAAAGQPGSAARLFGACQGLRRAWTSRPASARFGPKWNAAKPGSLRRSAERSSPTNGPVDLRCRLKRPSPIPFRSRCAPPLPVADLSLSFALP